MPYGVTRRLDGLHEKASHLERPGGEPPRYSAGGIRQRRRVEPGLLRAQQARALGVARLEDRGDAGGRPDLRAEALRERACAGRVVSVRMSEEDARDGGPPMARIRATSASASSPQPASTRTASSSSARTYTLQSWSAEMPSPSLPLATRWTWSSKVTVIEADASAEVSARGEKRTASRVDQYTTQWYARFTLRNPRDTDRTTTVRVDPLLLPLLDVTSSMGTAPAVSVPSAWL